MGHLFISWPKGLGQGSFIYFIGQGQGHESFIYFMGQGSRSWAIYLFHWPGSRSWVIYYNCQHVSRVLDPSERMWWPLEGPFWVDY